MGKKVLMSPNHSKTTPFLSKNKRAFSDLLDVSGNGRREKRALFPLEKNYCLKYSVFWEMKEGK